MRINLTTPMSDDKERQRRNEVILAAIEQYTEERMNDDHTATSQPTQIDALLEGDAQTILYLLGVRHGREDERAKIAAETRQPTQSDALREENERLRSVLQRTLTMAELYAEGTGTNFNQAMAEARAALEQSK